MDNIADAISQHFQNNSDSAGEQNWLIMADDEMDDFELDLDDDVDIFDAAVPSSKTEKKKDETDEERQLRIMEGWTSSMPYACESPEQMQEQLEVIVSKLLIAAESRHWEHLVAWDGALAS